MGLSVLPDAQSFLHEHLGQLCENEARHNLILGLSARLLIRELPGTRFFHFGAPGACAMQMPQMNIVLGDLSPGQCAELANVYKLEGWEFSGVVGPDQTAGFFSESFEKNHTQKMKLATNQRIYEIRREPTIPAGVLGSARFANDSDMELLIDWHLAFGAEAVPHDKARSREKLKEGMMTENNMLWVLGNEVMGLARIGRETPNGACIGPVFVSKEFRGRGFGEAITAALTSELFSRGKKFACLYTDLSNPTSNKIYQRIGYEPVCESKHWVKA